MIFFAIRTHILTVALGLILAGCASPAVKLPPLEQKLVGSNAEEVFEAGFSAIFDKYIDPVQIGRVTLEGLKGLSTIDSSLNFSRDDSHVIFGFEGREVARLQSPAPDDTSGWAKITVAMAEHAKATSAEMRQATDEQMFEAVFDGVLSDLDAFSRYAGAEDARRNRAKRDGFGGIGIRFKLSNSAVVISKVIENTPADKAGFKTGDRIVLIDGVSLTSKNITVVSDMLRGPTRSKVNLEVIAKDQKRSRKVTLERAHIVSETVFASKRDNILYLGIRSFNQDTAHSLAKKIELAQHQKDSPPLEGLILDLRGNPGGLLKQSVKAADLFLTEGQIVSTRGRHTDSLHTYEAGGSDLAGGLPIVVLVDGKSASAAEILAAALQDQERAVVMGTTSYGKGTVQTVLRLPNDGEITLTWSRFMAPSGYVLHGLGIRPVICTSGLTKLPKGRISSFLEASAETVATLHDWRTPGMQPRERRDTLRRSCPSQRRLKSLEIEAARNLLQEKALYGRALDLTTQHALIDK